MADKQRFGLGRPGWRPPSFPPGFPSLMHPPDRFSHQNYVQPEILLAAVAAASTAQQVLNERNSRTASYFSNMASLNNSFTCPNCTYSMSTDLLSLGQSHHHNPAPMAPQMVQSPHHQSYQAYKRNSASPQFGGMGGGAGGSPMTAIDRNRRYPIAQEFAANNFFAPMPPSPNAFSMQRQMQKTRKPYFMPYISEGAMLRGLKNGDFIKGILKINRHNYEESYIELSSSAGELPLTHNAPISGGGDAAAESTPKTSSPRPQSSLHRSKVMILSVHDRNRALHGDEVVIRVKDRSEWMVREPMYQSWRAGELSALFDENGQPISIPPVKPADASSPVNDDADAAGTKRGEILEFLPAPFRKRVVSENVGKAVTVPAKLHYDADVILELGALMEHCRREYGTKNEPVEELQNHIKLLSIGRDQPGQKADSSGNHSISFGNSVHAGRYHVTGHGAQRTTYRLLSDMPDEDWGIPDICLQKTAEVVYIFKPKNNREAVGQLKVMADGNRNWALFSPTDSRMPRMMVPAEQLPMGFFERPHDYVKMIFVAQIVEWAATAQFARGKLLRQVAPNDELDCETEALIAKATAPKDDDDSYCCSPTTTTANAVKTPSEQ